MYVQPPLCVIELGSTYLAQQVHLALIEHFQASAMVYHHNWCHCQQSALSGGDRREWREQACRWYSVRSPKNGLRFSYISTMMCALQVAGSPRPSTYVPRKFVKHLLSGLFLQSMHSRWWQPGCLQIPNSCNSHTRQLVQREMSA